MFLFIYEREIVEELTANIFINLWEKRQKVSIHTSVKAYLYQSAKNQAVSYARKTVKEYHSKEGFCDFPEEEGQSPEAVFIEGELKQKFSTVLQKVPERAQLAFKLHRMEGLKYKEIAEVMDISVAAVEKNITTALKILHKELFSFTKMY